MRYALRVGYGRFAEPTDGTSTPATSANANTHCMARLHGRNS